MHKTTDQFGNEFVVPAKITIDDDSQEWADEIAARDPLHPGDPAPEVEEPDDEEDAEDADAGPESVEDDDDDAPPAEDATRAEQRAYADAHDIDYPKSASAARIAEIIAEHLASE